MEKSVSSDPLLVLNVLSPQHHTAEVVSFLESFSKHQPVITTKPGLKVDKVSLYLPLNFPIDTLKEKVRAHFPFSFKMQSHTLTEDDWLNKWKEHFHPFKLTKTVKVIPSWHKKKKRTRFIEIILDPGYAFGTGLHETTQFLARMIEKKKRRAHTLLDVGVGSGILPILAAKVGYKDILGIDNDENAIDAAYENVKRNEVSENIALTQKDVFTITPEKQYDFIAANLNTATLLTASRILFSLMHKKSYLCISGIGLENRKAVHNHYKALGLRCIRKYIGKEWCGYLYKIKKPRTKISQKFRRKKSSNT